MTQTNRLKIFYVAPAQAQTYITINEGFRQFDRFAQINVLARDVEAEPSDPENGVAYILPANATGDHWGEAKKNALAFYDQGWQIIEPQEGFQLWVESEKIALVFSGEDWIDLPVSKAKKLGVNSEPDNINRLSVKSDAELLTHDDVTPGTGDARKIINKRSAEHTASVVFQNAYQGRTELGLMGEDAFAIKTSSNGSDFNTSFRLSAEENVIELFHPLKINHSEVLSNADKPVFVANIASANTSYADNSLIDLSASLDTHNAFDSSKQAFVVPASGIYFIQVGIVIRSVSSNVTIVRLRAFKNDTLGQPVSAVTADANITTVNDSSLLQLQAGDEITLRTTFNDANGAVKFFPSSRLLIYRVA